MEDKCYIPRKRKLYSQTEKYPRIRVSAEQYNGLVDLCNGSGLKMSDVVSRLLDFALEHAEVVDE